MCARVFFLSKREKNKRRFWCFRKGSFILVSPLNISGIYIYIIETGSSLQRSSFRLIIIDTPNSIASSQPAAFTFQEKLKKSMMMMMMMMVRADRESFFKLIDGQNVFINCQYPSLALPQSCFGGKRPYMYYTLLMAF